MAITLHRGSDFMSDRYKYDFGVLSYQKGWAQIDTKQDASYYGTWTNPELRQIFSYCEGDTCLTKCDTDADYVEAIRDCADWNKTAGYWIGIDPGFDNSGMKERFENLGLTELLH
jgi:hypothetical protein